MNDIQSREARFETVETIQPRKPFDWPLSLTFLRGFSPMHGEQITTEGALTKRILHRHDPIEFTVTRRNANELSLKLSSARDLDQRSRKEVIDRVSFFLSADEDLTEFYEAAAADPLFGPIALRLRGLHHVKFPSPFEAACWGAINQRIQMPIARKMKAAIVTELGGGWAFPAADVIREAGESTLRRILGNERKAATIFAMANAFTEVTDVWLREAPLDSVEAWLRGIYGVGEFTSGFVLYRGLGRFIRQPVTEKFIRAAEKIYRRSLDEEEARRLGARYGAWAGHWALYVWASTFDAVTPDSRNDLVASA